MKIIADENMSAVQEVFAPYGEVETFAGREINATTVATADVLLVRSVTKVDEQLLKDSSVKFVGSATIGTDHIDLNYLQKKGILFAHAPGCNAEAVVQYMFSVLCTLEPEWRSKSIGIVGCGNVGGRLFRRLSALGVACQVDDPFLNEAECTELTDLQTVLSADIICLHTPLTIDGQFPTHHIINREVLEQFIRPGALLINASRGGVIDNLALLAHLKTGADLKVVLDVWESEPEINLALLRQVNLATPHIAGYSVEGRLRGTLIVRDAMCRHLNLPVTEASAANSPVGLSNVYPVSTDNTVLLDKDQSLDAAILGSYQVAIDDQEMRRVLGGDGSNTSALFDSLRKNYAQRREFSYYKVSGSGKKARRAELELLGFKTS